jgi:hypothetical protein
MGNYISYDKREAEAFARSLAKERRRDEVKAREKVIWDGLVEEQLRNDRLLVVVPQPKRPRPQPDKERLKEAAIQRVIDELNAVADNHIAILRRGGSFPFGYAKTARRLDNHSRVMSTLLSARDLGINVLDRNLWVRFRALINSTGIEEEEYKSTVRPRLVAVLDAACARVRKAARDLIKQRSDFDRGVLLERMQELLDNSRKYRREGKRTSKAYHVFWENPGPDLPPHGSRRIN